MYPGAVTALLHRWRAGAPAAASEFAAFVDLSRERLALKRNEDREPVRLDRLDALSPRACLRAHLKPTGGSR